MNDLDSELRQLLSSKSGHDLSGIGSELDLVEALGVDSLAALRMLANVEKHFGVRFPDDRLSEYRTLDRMLSLINEQKGAER